MASSGSLARGFLSGELRGAPRKRLHARLWAFLEGHRYDAELADGISPMKSIYHGARADRITTRRACRRDAKPYRELSRRRNSRRTTWIRRCRLIPPRSGPAGTRCCRWLTSSPPSSGRPRAVSPSRASWSSTAAARCSSRRRIIGRAATGSCQRLVYGSAGPRSRGRLRQPLSFSQFKREERRDGT